MRLSLLILLLFVIPQIYPQEPGPGKGNGNPSTMPRDGMITGVVLESQSQQPMEFVNVVLYRMKDSVMVTGTITDASGKFTLKEVPYGRFYLIVNFIGYERKHIDQVMLNPQQKIADLGKISLALAAENLEGVEIIGDKQRVVYQIDKKVVNVSQDIQSAGGTAVDVLENVPSVRVDIEGNVSLRGSSSFTVLVDGRPTVLESSDALQQIPANTIDRIEIITNPSVKYDPDGTAGIINVVMKKQVQKGFNGIVNASVGTKDKYSSDLLLNYRIGKVNVFGGGDWSKRRFSSEGNSTDETYYTDTTNYRYTTSEGTMNRNAYGIRGGLDYYMTDNSLISFSGRYGSHSGGRNSISNLHIYDVPATTQTYTVSDNSSDRGEDFYELNANFQQKFNNIGHQLDVMAYYSSEWGDDWEEQKESYADSIWNVYDNFKSYIKTNETSYSNEFVLKADYVLPLDKKGKIEAGYQSKLDFENEDYIFNDFDTIQNEWVENDVYTNEFDFKRDIHSLYGIYSNQWKGFGYQLGLRGEYTYRNIKNVKSPDASVVERVDPFPSFHISWQIFEKDQFLLSYSRRVERVRGWFLDPFVSYMDPYNVRQGNPDLLDEFIDSYDLGYQRKFDGSYISLESYYRITRNKISRVKILQDDGVMLNTFQNMNNDYSLGGELSSNIEVTKWLNIFASVDFYQYWLKGEIEGESVDQSSFNWNTRLNANMKFKYDIRVQFSGNYQGPSVTAQGRSEGFFVSNLSARKDLFQRKLSITLSARDLFRTAKRESTTTGSGFYSYEYMRREAPVVMLTLSFRINDYKKTEQRQQNGENGGDDYEEM